MSQPYMYDENGKLFPWYKKPAPQLNVPSWTQLFEEEYRKKWEEDQQKLENAIWGTGQRISYNEWRDKLKQQHMTPISAKNDELIKAVSNALYGSVNVYSCEYAKTAIELIEREGFCFCKKQKDENKESNPNLCAQLAPGQSTGEAYAKTGTGYSSQSYTTEAYSIKPFLMIDINAIKGKDYTVEEITQIFEQTGISVIKRKKNLTWGQAMEQLKEGKKVARTGWNGNGMFVYYVPPASYPSITDVAKNEFGSHVYYEGYFAIKNTKGTVNTWTPSVSDNLAEDWYVVE